MKNKHQMNLLQVSTITIGDREYNNAAVCPRCYSRIANSWDHHDWCEWHEKDDVVQFLDKGTINEEA